MTTEDDTITIYSDYVCPFCYLGRKSLESYEDDNDADLDIDWRPFDLRSHKRRPDGSIDHSVEDGKDDSYFDQVRENVQKLKENYDADEMLAFDDLPDDIDSFDAQVASLYVREEHSDDWLSFDEALFEALWVDGRDIGDRDVLADIAESVGLDAAAIRDAVADDDLRDRIRSRFRDAHEAGITGVPTFVYDGHAARGAVPPEHLRRLVDGT